MPNNRNNKDVTLKLPDNINLPFFAYGIFKPGQLAYSKIERYVDNSFPSQIGYKMLMRDGVPIIMPQDRGNPKTNGYLIEFGEDPLRAYKTICKTQHNELYRWDVIDVDGFKANVLMGINPKLGSSPIEMEIGDYDGRNDPFFKEALETVEEELKDENKHWSNMNDFFRLQMSYMLLWASIERYCSLKYYNSGSKINQFSRDRMFKKALRRHVHSERTVYSADDLVERTLNPEEPYDSVRYYYTIRCNVAHRGKALHTDEHMLRKSLDELLKIFRDVLRDTFDES